MRRHARAARRPSPRKESGYKGDRWVGRGQPLPDAVHPAGRLFLIQVMAHRQKAALQPSPYLLAARRPGMARRAMPDDALESMIGDRVNLQIRINLLENRSLDKFETAGQRSAAIMALHADLFEVERKIAEHRKARWAPAARATSANQKERAAGSVPA
jgi:hypothetical protein